MNADISGLYPTVDSVGASNVALHYDDIAHNQVLRMVCERVDGHVAVEKGV